MAQPTLDERFKKGPPTRAEGESHGWMIANERRFILWGLKEGWSAARIGRGLGVNDATVRRFRTKFAKDPGLIFQLDTFEIVGRAKNDEYRCLVCRDHVLGRREIERHVLRHFLDESKVDEMLPREESTAAESSPDIDAPDIPAVQDRGEDLRAPAFAAESADEKLEVTTAASEGPKEPEDFERLVAQIGADGTFEEVLKRALSEVSRRRSQSDPDTQPTPAASISRETPQTLVREPLTLTQLQERRDARLREVESTEAGEEPGQDDGSEAPGAVSDDAGRVIPLPPPPDAEVETPASAPADLRQPEGPPTGRQDASEQIRVQDQEPTETEMMRLAFERLKAQTSEQPVSEPRSVESDSPVQGGEQTNIEAETAPEGPLDTTVARSDPSGVGAESYLEPDGVPSEIEIRRAAYERLRAQTAEQDTVSPPPPGQSLEESERARTRRELERLLGESVSPPQEGPDDTPPLSPPAELRDPGPSARSSVPDAPPHRSRDQARRFRKTPGAGRRGGGLTSAR
jgi:hypothetical protein